MKVILYFLLSLLVFIASCGSGTKIYIQVIPKTLEFQTTFVGQKKSLTVTFKNSTSNECKITDVRIAGQHSSKFAITAGWSGTEITVDGMTSINFTVEFEPTTPGDKTATFEVEHDHPTAQNPLQNAIRAKSIVNTTIEVTPDNFNFRFVPLNDTQTEDLALENTGSVGLEVTDLEFIGSAKNEFSVTAGWSGSLSIQPSEIKIITVAFTPTVEGNKSVRLRVTHTGVNSPFDVVIYGGGGYGYFEETFPVGMNSIRHTGTDIRISNYEDDVSYEVQIGYTFVYFGNSYTNIWVCDNGWISFGSQSYTDPDAYTSTAIPNPDRPNNAAYVFWYDFEFNRSTINDARWVYQLSGSAPNRVLTVEWYKFNRYNASPPTYGTFQVKLYETTNIIEFLYSSATGEWSYSTPWSATIGLENINGTRAYQKFGSPTIGDRPSTNYRYTP